MVHQNFGGVLFNQGLVLLQIPGDLIDVHEVDPQSSNNQGGSWTVAVQDLDDQSCFVMKRVIYIERSVDDLFDG